MSISLLVILYLTITSLSSHPGGNLWARSAHVSCPEGHPMVVNQNIPGKAFPSRRMYGACDVCEARGTMFRYLLSVYSLGVCS